MNRFLLVLGALAASALLVPGDADAQRFGGRGGGGARIGGGGFGGGGSFRSGGFAGGSRMYIPRGGVGGSRIGVGGDGRMGGAIAARPGGVPGRVAGIRPGTGGYRQAAVGSPGGRFDNRPRDGRYGVRPPGYYGGRYPYYGGYYGGYPYYGGWGTAGLVTGSIVGAASTYPPYTTASSTVGGYCATSVRTCALTSSAPVGTGCSCRTSSGRARGTVVGR